MNISATNSGLQWYSLLARDEVGAQLCNVVKMDKIADAYAKLADALNDAVATSVFNRSNVKHAFMTFLYGAGKMVILRGKDEADSSRDKSDIGYLFNALGIDQEAAWGMFVNAMKVIAPNAIAIMDLIYLFRNSETAHYAFTMPDGFAVNIQISEATEIKGYSVDMKYNTTHTGTLTTYVPSKDDSKGKSLAPNIVHAIDSYALREVQRKCDFDLMLIHDSFGAHPNNVDALRQAYKEVMVDVLEGNLLEDILGQINAPLLNNIKRKGKLAKGNLTAEDVMASEYALR